MEKVWDDLIAWAEAQKLDLPADWFDADSAIAKLVEHALGIGYADGQQDAEADLQLSETGEGYRLDADPADVEVAARRIDGIAVTYTKAKCIERAEFHERDAGRRRKDGYLWAAGISLNIAAKLREAAEDGRA